MSIFCSNSHYIEFQDTQYLESNDSLKLNTMGFYDWQIFAILLHIHFHFKKINSIESDTPLQTMHIDFTEMYIKLHRSFIQWYRKWCWRHLVVAKNPLGIPFSSIVTLFLFIFSVENKLYFDVYWIQMNMHHYKAHPPCKNDYHSI